MPRVKGRNRASSGDRPSRAGLLVRRARRALRPAAFAAAAFIGVVLVAVLLHRAAPESSRPVTGFGLRAGVSSVLGMRIRHVVIEGRANTPEPLLRAAIGVTPGQPILAYSVAAARTRIESLSWVSAATVERRLPGTIVVHLEERRPFAIWQDRGRFLLIDRAGQVVAHQDVSAFRSLPLVVGEGAPKHAAGLLDALQQAPQVAARVAAAVRVGRRRWNLQLTNGIDVLLPEAHAPTAIARLAQLQTAHDLLDRPLLLVDLRLPDRMVIRPAPIPPTPIPPTSAPAAAAPAAATHAANTTRRPT